MLGLERLGIEIMDGEELVVEDPIQSWITIQLTGIWCVPSARFFVFCFLFFVFCKSTIIALICGQCAIKLCIYTYIAFIYYLFNYFIYFFWYFVVF